MYISHIHAGPHGDQERLLDPLKLDLWMVVSNQMWQPNLGLVQEQQMLFDHEAIFPATVFLNFLRQGHVDQADLEFMIFLCQPLICHDCMCVLLCPASV